MSYEFLRILWFILIAVLWIGFFFLEGFDFGVGMLFPFLGKKDEERRAIINSIGPSGMVMKSGYSPLAAQPLPRSRTGTPPCSAASILPLFLLLIGLIIRGVSFEYRSKNFDPAWRNRFDWMIAIGSFLASLLLGTAFANLAKGVPIGADMNYSRTAS